MKTSARFPDIDISEGHYESFFLKASDPAGGRAVWIRHTVLRRPGEELDAAVWFTYFDASRGPPRAARRRLPQEAISAPAEAYIRIDGAELGPGWCRGQMTSPDLTATWGLRFNDHHDPLRYLPEWAYRRRLPRTKLTAPHPGALFDGTIELDGERIDVTAWPGIVGHNWGAEHAERWVWIHGTSPKGAASTDYLDFAAGRARLGVARTPWIAFGRLILAGEQYELGGWARARRTKLDPSETSCRFTVPGEGVTVEGTIAAPAERFVEWVYADPSGGERDVLNCSISDLDFRVRRRGRDDRELSIEAGAVYEFGSGATAA